MLAIIAMRGTLPDSRSRGRLPKYNPERRKTFSLSDWQHVCAFASEALRGREFIEIVEWLDKVQMKNSPGKRDQDCLDACLCLLVALHLVEREDCLMVGDRETGYIVAPHSKDLVAELEARCNETNRPPSEWVRVFRLSKAEPMPAAGVPIASSDTKHDYFAGMDGAEAVEMEKRYHDMTQAERTSARIAKNKAIEQKAGRRAARWRLDEIVDHLNVRKQRASYGAVATLVGVLPRGLMNGRLKSSEYAWVVAASGSHRGWPTGYAIEQIHPDCLRQIRDGRENIIETGEDLERWFG